MKIKLVESYLLNPDDYIKVNTLNENQKTIVIEKKGEKKQEFTAKAVFSFPISRPDEENLNGRVYNKKLWENVEKNLKNSSTFGLMNHPESEGSTKDIWCVWRNLRFSEDKKTVVADAYLVGKWGEMVKEILEAGGQVGLSTSGYGEFLEDKKTVNPDTYELERVADFVFNPSYEVYGTLDDKIEKVEMREEEDMTNNKLEKELKGYVYNYSDGIAFYERNDSWTGTELSINDFTEILSEGTYTDSTYYTIITEDVEEEAETLLNKLYQEFEEKKTKKKEEDPKEDDEDKEDGSKKDDEEDDEEDDEVDEKKKKKKEEEPDEDDEVDEKKKKKEEKPEDNEDEEEVDEKKKKKKEEIEEDVETEETEEIEEANTDTFKCPDCGGKVLTNTEYCVSCKKKVKNEKEKKEESMVEKFFRKNMTATFKLAKDKKTPEERIEAYEDLLSYFEDDFASSLKNEIEEELEKEKTTLTQIDEEASNNVNTEALLVEKNELEEKYKNALDLLDSLKVYAKKLKEMYEISQAEKNGMVTATEYKEIQVYLENVEKEKEELEKELITFKTESTNEINKIDENVEIVDEKKTIIPENINPEVLRYYNNLEYSNPSAVIIKEDILRCRTLMEAQKTALRLKPLWEKVESAYDRKFVGGKDTFVESSKQTLPIKEGWL